MDAADLPTWRHTLPIPPRGTCRRRESLMAQIAFRCF